MEFKGTKGKWNIKNVVDEKSWINITSEKDILARVFFGDAPPIIDKNEAIANAKLIASATNLLEALQYIKMACELNSKHAKKNKDKIAYSELSDIASKAINKALKTE